MTRIQWLQEELLRDGYVRIETNLPQYSLYYKKEDMDVRGVFLAELLPGQWISSEQMQHIHAQIYRILERVGDNPGFLTLAAGEDILKHKMALAELPLCWLWDTCSGRLIIYENQPTAYYGIEHILRKAEDRISDGSKRMHPSGKYRYRRPKAIMNTTMIAMNVLVFLWMEMIGSTENTQFMLDHGASYAPWILEYGEYWRLFTSMFLHFGISHLGNNMLVLFLLGDNVERAVGRWKYTVIYLLSGLCGSLFSFAGALVTREFAVCAGASGAIFGIIGALFYIVAVNRGRLEDMTTRKLGIMIAVSLYHGFTSTGVDNLAHIGGMVGGVFLALALYGKNKNSY